MCTMGTIKLSYYVLFKTRDPVKGMKTEDGVVREENGLFIKNEEGVYGGIGEKGISAICSVVRIDGEYETERFIGNIIPDVVKEGDITKAVGFARAELSNYAPGNLIIASADRCFVLESTGSEVNAVEVRDKVVRTNHFIYIHAGPRKKEEYPSTFIRYRRARELLESVKSVDDLKSLLKDHENGPSENSICRHGERFTSSAFILETAPRKVHYTSGHPCEGEFREYTLAEE